MAMLKVNGADMPPPSAMKVTIFDVSSAVERNASGNAVVDRVAVKRRLDLKWAHLGADNLQLLLQAIGGNGFFTASYPDPQTGSARTMECYCGDRATGVLRMVDGVPLWTNVEMTWTER